MKLLFINPPINKKPTFPPIGIMYLQSFLKQKKFDVRFFEASNKTYEDIKNCVEKYKPDFIGISCWTIGLKKIYDLIKYLKNSFDIKILCGGQHASFCTEQVLDVGADFVFTGESEQKLVEFLNVYPDLEQIKKIGNVSFKNLDGSIFFNNNFYLTSNLDDLPFPCYDDIDKDNYIGLKESSAGNKIAGMISSRGCPYACNFCSSSFYWNRKTHFRSAENIIKEIKYLIIEKKYEEIIFYDDNFFLDKKRVIEICKKIIEEKLNFKWIALGRVNNVDDSVLSYVKKAGCYRIDFGVESGSQKILDNIGKNIKIEQILNAVKLTTKYKIDFHPYLITGSPGESIETIEDTVKLLHSIKVKPEFYGSNIMWVLPGTPLYNDYKKVSKITDDIWLGKNEVFYTKELSIETLQLFENFLSFNVPKGFLKEYNILKDAFVYPLNTYFKNKKVYIYGNGEVAEIIKHNKSELNFNLEKNIEEADFIFVASVSNGELIKNRYKGNNMYNKYIVFFDIIKKLKLKFDINFLNSKILIYKRMKNKILFDLKYFENNISKILVNKNSFISFLLIDLIKSNLININYEYYEKKFVSIEKNNSIEKYEWNDFYYALNRRRL